MTELRCGTCGELEPDKWISVKDQLPKEAGYYIVASCWSPVKLQWHVGEYRWCIDGNGYWMDCCGEQVKDDGYWQTTHWMPLPSPPEDKP